MCRLQAQVHVLSLVLRMALGMALGRMSDVNLFEL